MNQQATLIQIHQLHRTCACAEAHCTAIFFSGQGEDVRRELQRIYSRDQADAGQQAAQMPLATPTTTRSDVLPKPTPFSSALLSSPAPLSHQQRQLSGGVAAATRIAAVAAIGQHRLTAHILSHLNNTTRGSGASPSQRLIAARHDFRRRAETGSPLHSSFGSTVSECLPLVPEPVGAWRADAGFNKLPPPRLLSTERPASLNRGGSLLQRCVAASGAAFNRGAVARGASPAKSHSRGPGGAAPQSPTRSKLTSDSLVRSSSLSSSGGWHLAAPAGPALVITSSYGSFSVVRSPGSVTRMGEALRQAPTLPRGHLAHRAAVMGFGGAVPAGAWENNENAAPTLDSGSSYAGSGMVSRQDSGYSECGSCPVSPRMGGPMSLLNSNQSCAAVRVGAVGVV